MLILFLCSYIMRMTQSAAMTLCLAISYGGRDEITRVAQTLAQAVQAGRLQPQDITEELFQGITLSY
jgi:undecaprenyl diphosphate synthase